MAIFNKLNGVLIAITLFSANCMYAENETVTKKTEIAALPYQGDLEADRAALETVKEELAQIAVSKNKNSVNTREEIEAVRAELAAIKAEKAELEAQAELQALKAQLAAVTSSSVKAKSEIDTYKAELDNVKAQLQAITAAEAVTAQAEPLMNPELESVKADLAAINSASQEANSIIAAYKAELELVKAELETVKTEFANKATRPVLGMDNPTDLYMPAPEQSMQNSQGETLWKSKSEEMLLLKDTRDYNYDKFVSRLSKFGRYEWGKMSREQKLKAMELADRTQTPPDSAVFIVDEHY